MKLYKIIESADGPISQEDFTIVLAMLRKEESYLNTLAINEKNKGNHDAARAKLAKCNFLYDLQKKISKQLK